MQRAAKDIEPKHVSSYPDGSDTGSESPRPQPTNLCEKMVESISQVGLKRPITVARTERYRMTVNMISCVVRVGWKLSSS
jgi:hypothetical protein